MASKWFGGGAGKAEDSLKGRKAQLDAAERAAMGETTPPPPPKKEEKKEEKKVDTSRPPQSKKWYE